MRLTKSARANRIPCRGCAMPIDLDWSNCPYCGTQDPIPSWRMIRPGIVMLAVGLLGVMIALGMTR